MSKIGIYPGTFDPITFGHIDIIKRTLKIVNKLIVAVSNDNSKEYLFSDDERVSIIKNALFEDLNFIKSNITVVCFDTLTTSLCKKYNATTLFRGLRAASDFEYDVLLLCCKYKSYTHVTENKCTNMYFYVWINNKIIATQF